MIPKIILSFSLFFSIPSSYACINTYAFDLGRDGLDQQTAHEELKQISKKFKTHQELNDYGVLLIYAQQYNRAIEVFNEIEESHPYLAKTAANLGTAYELKGDLKQAKYWIQQGMQRDPNIHHGSEWIHIKILDAQINQLQDKQWIKHNDVLGLDFGQKAQPTAKVKSIDFNDQTFSLDEILEHSKIQMDQRLRFVEHDPISAQILFNMANIEVELLSGGEDEVWSLYELADSTGFVDKALIEKRIHYIRESKWYAFKRFVVEMSAALMNLFKG